MLRYFLFLLLGMSVLNAVHASPRKAPAAPAAKITLHSEVVVIGRNVKLADIAAIDASDEETKRRLDEVRIGNAPMVGHLWRMTKQELERLIRRQMPEASHPFTWEGASEVKLRTAARSIDASAIVNVAKSAVQEALGNRFDQIAIELASPIADVELPLGELVLKPRAIDGARVQPRIPVWVDIVVDNALYRSVVVPLIVSVHRTVYTAKRDLPEGTMVSADDFAAHTEEGAPESGNRIKFADLQNGFRIKKALTAGEVLLPKHVAAKDTVFPGEKVTLVAKKGAVIVEAAALVQQEAQVGQLVKVKTEKGMDTVEGRLISTSVVQAIGR